MTISADSIERDLRSIIRGDVEFDPISRHLYSTDAGISRVEPLGVVSPRDAEDVARLVTYAAAQGLSLVPRGMGSGLAGGAVGTGIQVDFARYMTSILEVAPDGSWARVQPGVVMASLNRHVKAYGTFFAPDPSSENYCSLGGMIGTNSSGARSVAYGGTKDHVLALEVVLADGSRFSARPYTEKSPELAALLASKTAGGRAFATILPELEAKREIILAGMPRVVKNCSGYRLETILGTTSGVAPPQGAAPPDSPIVYQLQKMFVGAEGTLGLVTEATLNLVPLPAARGIAMAYFPSVFACGEAVPDILALSPSAVEIMDSRFLAFVRSHDSRIDAMLPDRTDTALLIEFEGRDQEELDEKFAALGRRLGAGAALKMVRAVDASETQRLWTVRKSAVALALRMPGPRRPLPFIEDVTVHPTEVAGYVDFLQRLFDRENVEAVMYGHVGDGNIHARPLLDAKDPQDLRTMQRLYEEVSGYVLGVRGTMSGEHGDGLLRTPHIREMYGDEIYSLFGQVKDAFDPQGMMNPGKKVAPQEASGSLLRDLRYGPDYRTVPQKPILHFPNSEYEREIEKCHGCGQCKSMVVTTMCPTYKATRREHASPRAKANLLRSIITGALDPNSAYGLAAHQGGHRLLHRVRHVCRGMPFQRQHPQIDARGQEQVSGSASGQPGRDHPRASRDGLTPRPSRGACRQPADEPLAGPTARRAAHGHRPATGDAAVRPRDLPPEDGHGTSERDRGTPRRRDRPRTAPSCRPTWRRKGGNPPPKSQWPISTISLPSTTTPTWREAAMRVLAAHDVRVLLPEQRASGIPEMLYGYARRAREVAEFNVRSFLPAVQSGAVPVSTEPTASFAFKVHYPDYFPGSDCSLVANAARDLGEFLVSLPVGSPRAQSERGSSPTIATRPSDETSSFSAASSRVSRSGGRRPSSHRLSPAMPPEGPADRQPRPGAHAGDPRRGDRRSGRRLLRDGRHLRHEGGDLRFLHADGRAPLRAHRRCRPHSDRQRVQHVPNADSPSHGPTRRCTQSPFWTKPTAPDHSGPAAVRPSLRLPQSPAVETEGSCGSLVTEKRTGFRPVLAWVVLDDHIYLVLGSAGEFDHHIGDLSDQPPLLFHAASFKHLHNYERQGFLLCRCDAGAPAPRHMCRVIYQQPSGLHLPVEMIASRSTEILQT